jgi:xylulokinase
MEENGITITELRAIGGGARSPFWLQMKADLTGRGVVVPKVTEAAALGAAVLAGVGSKAYRGVEEGVKSVYREKAVYVPREKVAKAYERYYALYKRLYSDLKGLFVDVGKI